MEDSLEKKQLWIKANPQINPIYYPSDWWISKLREIVLNLKVEGIYSVWDKEYREAEGVGMIATRTPFVPHCLWTANPKDYSGHDTTCFNSHEIQDWDTDYNMNAYKFCMFCGKPMRQVIADDKPILENFVRVSGVWQKVAKEHYSKFSESKWERFQIDPTTIENYDEVIGAIRGHSLSVPQVQNIIDSKGK